MKEINIQEKMGLLQYVNSEPYLNFIRRIFLKIQSSSFYVAINLVPRLKILEKVPSYFIVRA